MTELFDVSLTPTHLALLIGALIIALGFEFVNGFHDTANAVATVIYTRSLRPTHAVLLSGLFNFIGVFVGGIAVAMSIMHLLPVELLVSSSPGLGLAMVLSLLLAAILWNLGTWYLGLPASSSHTLIGAILGVGLASSLFTTGSVNGVNWAKAGDVGLSLLLSPVIGFALSAGLLFVLTKVVKDRRIDHAPSGDERPPSWIRGVLVATSAGVSFAHGSNDGQKGVGLIMLILTGMLPVKFALDMNARPETLARTRQATIALERVLDTDALACGQRGRPVQLASTGGAVLDPRCAAIGHLREIDGILAGRTGVADIPDEQRWMLRTSLLRFDEAAKQVELGGGQQRELKRLRKQLGGLTEYAPIWVLVAVALALGIGTTVGWKRIVVTVGEKIGKTHLTYAQGASAELVAMSTIGLSGLLGLPVSTTHILSSGIAGTMVSRGSGIQARTVRNIALAWILTLPASILLAGLLFAALRTLLG